MPKATWSVITALALVALIGLTMWWQRPRTSPPSAPPTPPEAPAPRIPPDQIIDGGPGKDGIPSIDRPTFSAVSDAATYLRDEGLGISIVTERTKRFYPFQIIVWHEIVNDAVDGVPIAVTYCPLCGTGFTFDRRVDEQTYGFGVSGKLFQNNLLMYDRTTETLWQQQTGEAVVGALVGKRLAIVPSENIRWGDWKRLYPDGEVLSRETGYRRDYSFDPYASRGYNEDPSPGLFPGTPLDPRLHAKALVIGIVVGDAAKAYAWEAVRREKVINDTIGGLLIVVFEDPASRAITMRTRPSTIPITDPAAAAALPDRPEHTTSFWFSWAAFHPNTDLVR